MQGVLIFRGELFLVLPALPVMCPVTLLYVSSSLGKAGMRTLTLFFVKEFFTNYSSCVFREVVFDSVCV